MSHLPFRSWRRHCVAGKALSAAHRSGIGSGAQKIPTISLDYFYLGDDEENSQPSLILTDCLTQRVFAVCACKGVGHQFNAAIVEKYCKILGYPRAVLKSDAEASILALRSEIQRRLPHFSAENATKGESQSNAQAESMVGKIQGQARTLRSALEANYGCAFTPRHPAFAWLIGYAASLWSRFQRGVDGKTGFERSTGKRWRQPLPQFGECVWYQPLKESGTRKKKFDAKFRDGVYLGIQENSLLKWIGTPEGVVRAWSIKLRPESEKWNVDEFNGFVRPSSSRDGMKILPGIEKDLVVEIQDNVDQPKKDVVVEVKRKGYVARGIYLRKDVELAMYGYTDGCDGCVSAQHGLSRKQRSAACRERGSPRRWSRLKKAGRAKTRETAYFLAHHEREQREEALASKRSAEEGDQKEAKKRVVEFEVDIPLPDLEAPVSTSPDPLPAEELPGQGEGGGKRDGGQSRVDHSWS